MCFFKGRGRRTKVSRLLKFCSFVVRRFLGLGLQGLGCSRSTRASSTGLRVLCAEVTVFRLASGGVPLNSKPWFKIAVGRL